MWMSLHWGSMKAWCVSYSISRKPCASESSCREPTAQTSVFEQETKLGKYTPMSHFSCDDDTCVFLSVHPLMSNDTFDSVLNIDKCKKRNVCRCMLTIATTLRCYTSFSGLCRNDTKQLCQFAFSALSSVVHRTKRETQTEK